MLENVRVELFRRRWPVHRFAREIGISESRLRRILAGRVKLLPGELERILEPLGLTENVATERAA